MAGTLAAAARRLLAEARSQTGQESPLLDSLSRDPASVFSASGVTPDPWQEQTLRSKAPRTLLLCSRQAGKSLTAAALALHTALTVPKALVLLLSRAERQASELFRKMTELYAAAGRPVAKSNDMSSELHLANGSRVIPLPGKEDTIRSFSAVTLLIVDEASRVPDSLYYAVRPMLAVSRGRLLALSTPFGKRGWFYDEWTGTSAWERVKVTADRCPRISPAFLAEERLALGERWYAQEYLCSFEDAVGAVFSAEDIAAALCDDVSPLFS